MSYADLDTELRNEYGDLRRMPIVVAFTGKRGSGKSKAAEVLIERHGFKELKFADPLKNMLRAMYATCGVDADTIERKMEGGLKEEPCVWLLGQTPRYAMQTLGTEWREMIGTELWSEMFIRAVESGNLGQRIVCSDYRFPHEGEVLRKLGAVIYKVHRDTADAVDDVASQHESETLMDLLPCDISLQNNGTLEEFLDMVDQKISSGLELVDAYAALATGGRVSGGEGYVVGEATSD